MSEIFTSPDNWWLLQTKDSKDLALFSIISDQKIQKLEIIIDQDLDLHVYINNKSCDCDDPDLGVTYQFFGSENEIQMELEKELKSCKISDEGENRAEKSICLKIVNESCKLLKLGWISYEGSLVDYTGDLNCSVDGYSTAVGWMTEIDGPMPRHSSLSVQSG